MGEGIANLQNVLRSACERVTQLQEGVQREDRGLRELQQWAATQNDRVARRLQFLYQQFAQFGPQMDILGQGYRKMQLVYQACLDELNTQRRQREVRLRNEVLQIMHNYQRQMEGSMKDSVFQQVQTRRSRPPIAPQRFDLRGRRFQPCFFLFPSLRRDSIAP